MSIDYDPYAHEVMSDPRPIYARLRAESPVHRLEKYDAWALSRFDDVWNALLEPKIFTATQGVSPGQILLGEPFPPTFMTMDAPEHRRHRSIIGAAYAKRSIDAAIPKIRALAREILLPLLEQGGFEVYADYANRVATIVIGDMLGIERERIEPLRGLVDRFFHREPGQVGTSAANAQVGEEMGGELAGIVAERRAAGAGGEDHISRWIEADVDGRQLSDEEIVANIYSILVTGSETVPLSVTATLYYLAQQPEQLARVLADPEQIPHACAEAIRIDQPTNVLGRKLTEDVEIRGQQLRAGQGVLFLYCSANCDEAEFERAGVYDMSRRPKRSLSFGHGIHKCLGEHLGFAECCIMVEELLTRLREISIDPAQCERVYGEFLSGFGRVPIQIGLR